MSVALSAATLRGELAGSMAVPAYDRSAVRSGIVHIGVGGFHRAHQAMYVDRLMNAGGSLDWGICGVGLLPQDRRMKDVLDAQDGLYTVVLKHPDGTLEPRVIGSIVEYLFAPDDTETVIERLAAPTTRIVSLTITEGGYNIRHDTGRFDESEPRIVDDLRPGAVPTSVFGIVTEALVRRRERGVAPFTVMSCDNIAGNGRVAAAMFGAFARLRDPDLGAWVEGQVRFPSSMVDRITPATTDQDRALVAERFGITDGWPVVCEPFTQWILEDDFGTGRPPLEEVGVQVVDDVEPYELMKLRLLNAGHQAIGYLGYLAGHRYAHEVCQDPLFVRFLRSYLDREATPTLSEVPGIDLEGYKRTLIERFANPHVADTLARLCVDGSERIPTFLLPVIRHQLATGGDIDRCALVVAAWARYAEGVDEDGRPIDVVDRRADALLPAAARQRQDLTALLESSELFGDLIDHPRFVAAYSSSLRSLHERGSRATVECLEGSTTRGHTVFRT